MKTWIVVARRTEAKVFEYENKSSSEVKFVTKLENPRGRLRPHEINADKPGIFLSLMNKGTKLVKPQSPIERVAQEFAKKVAEFLEISRQRQEFDNIVLIADPHFLGRLRGSFSKKLYQCVHREIAKDLGSATSQELKSRLWPETISPLSP